MWEQDLAYGEEGERMIAELLNAKKVDWQEGYDLNWKGQRIEVKRDRRARETGNLCFEDSLLTQVFHYLFVLVDGTDDIYVFTKKECLDVMKMGYKMKYGGKRDIYLVNRAMLSQFKKTKEEIKCF